MRGKRRQDYQPNIDFAGRDYSNLLRSRLDVAHPAGNRSNCFRRRACARLGGGLIEDLLFQGAYLSSRNT